MRSRRAAILGRTPRLAALLLGALASSPVGAAPATGPGPEAFASVVKAWQARDAADVVALMATDGRLMLSLEGTGSGRVSGRPTWP